MKVNKTVCFNDEDAFEMRLIEHMEKQGKFSAYVKRLMAQDMAGIAPPPAQHIVITQAGYAPSSPIAATKAAEASMPELEAMAGIAQPPQAIRSDEDVLVANEFC